MNTVYLILAVVGIILLGTTAYTMWVILDRMTDILKEIKMDRKKKIKDGGGKYEHSKFNRQHD